MGKDTGIQFNDNINAGIVLDLKVQTQLDANGKILRGIVIGNTLRQNQALILIEQPNCFKGNPTLGVGLQDNLLGENLLEYRHKIREQFAMDGMKVTQLELYAIDQLKIEAHYE